MIYDSGCTTTQYPCLDFWDYENFKFSIKSQNNLNMENWNLHIRGYSENTVKTANGLNQTVKIFLNFPFYLKIGNLEPIEMYSFIFPLKKPNINPEFFLLGLDFIGKIKSIIEPDEYLLKVKLSLKNIE